MQNIRRLIRDMLRAKVPTYGNSIEVLHQSAPDTSKSDADTNEGTLATIAIPALGPNDRVFMVERWQFPSSTVNRILRHRLNGTLFHRFDVGTSAAPLTAYFTTEFQNQNSRVLQLSSGDFIAGFGTNGNAFTQTAIDTSVPTTLTLTGTWASAGVVGNITLKTLGVYLARFQPGL